MFDFAWSEFALIGVVALIAIGPKDLPVALKTVAQMVKKARKMAGEFQTHVDEMLRDADLADVKSQIKDIRNFDFKGTLERTIDSDGSIRKTFNDDPTRTTSFAAEPVTPINGDTAGSVDGAADATDAGEPHGRFSTARPSGETMSPVPDIAVVDDGVPSFVPPSLAHPPRAPAFVPPGVTSPEAWRPARRTA